MRSGFSPENRRILESWSWPGNIRELRNVIEQSVVLTGGRHLTLPDPVEHTEASRGVGALGGGEMPEELVFRKSVSGGSRKTVYREDAGAVGLAD